jgi:hypothetical protein
MPQVAQNECGLLAPEDLQQLSQNGTTLSKSSAPI